MLFIYFVYLQNTFKMYMEICYNSQEILERGIVRGKEE